MCNQSKILYKYLSCNEGSKAVLSNFTIKYTKPSNFNDPFDCKVFSFSDWKVDDWANFLSKYPEHREQALPLAKRIMDENLCNFNFTDSFGVFCLSEVNNDILMWSHYADSHKGFCVGFHVNESYFTEIFPVNYIKKYPKILPIASSEDTAKTIMLSKSCHWKYEQEWRKIKLLELPNNNILSEVQSYPKEIVASVIFGAKISPDFRQKLLNIIDQKCLNIDLFDAKPCENEFALKINKIIL
jgi:hypothetical protein